jgi:hypothetical protein
VERTLIELGRGLFLRHFLKHVDKEAARRHLRVAAEHRLRDRNMHDAEKERIKRFVERWALDQ